MSWQKIDTAPDDFRQILVGFKGQFEWVFFVANAYGAETKRNEYAAPTHWFPIVEPQE
jgi:hypothetical protein